MMGGSPTFLSPSVSSNKEQKDQMAHLNNRMAAYVEKVFNQIIYLAVVIKTVFYWNGLWNAIRFELYIITSLKLKIKYVISYNHFEIIL